METVEKKEEVKEEAVVYDALMEITATFLTKEDTMRTYKAMKLIKNITSHADSVRECVAHAEDQKREGEVSLGTHIKPSDFEAEFVFLD